MANLIDEEYFINDISLPNLNKDAELSALTASIVKYQKEVLKYVLGYELYSLFITDPGSEQRFIDIRDGKGFTFTFNGKQITREYIGLANEELESLIAYYTYSYHIRTRITTTNGIGETIPLSENSMRASASDKLVRSWQKFTELAGEPLDCERISTYGCGYTDVRSAKRGRQCSYPCFDKLEISTYDFADDSGSLFNFLLANKDVYPEWEFTPLGQINHMGI